MDEFYFRIVAFTIAIIPSFVILGYFAVAAKVKIGHELVWNCFGFGACAAFPVIMFAGLFSPYLDLGDGIFNLSLKRAFFEAAIPEEIFKFFALICVCKRYLHKISARQIFVMSIACACGFACLENIFYVVESENWHRIAFLRSMTAVPGHAFVGATMGYFIVQARDRTNNPIWWGLAIVVPIILHGTYDFLLFANDFLDGRYVGNSSTHVLLFTLLFILVVILEGLLAHYLLNLVLNYREQSQEVYKSLNSVSLIWRRVEKINTNFLSWICLGSALIIAAIIFGFSVKQLGNSEDIAFGLGVSIFAFLHGVAFIGLSVIVKRRQKAQF